jgi:DNA-binding transcriptional MerR regulator
MGTHHPIRKTVTPAPVAIPDKLYFRIGDVAKLCGVAAYVLRFWETEFPQLKPNKGGTGQRLYRRKDVEMALRIKALLYDKGFTIPGARQALRSEADAFETGIANAPLGEALHLAPSAERSPSQPQLSALRDELQALATMLALPPGTPVAPVKVRPMRPRLVEAPPRPRVEVKEPVARPSLQQGDLFGGE